MSAEHYLLFSKFSPINEGLNDIEIHFVWGKQTRDYKFRTVCDIIENCRKRIDNNKKDAITYPSSKSWYIERLQVNERILERLLKYKQSML